ncbi:MAG: PrgI family protein [Patescibacteria group bacterium]
MEQHPIPQQISSYEFRLIGSMTIKQFAKLAGGLLVAFLIYTSKLNVYIKWPLIACSGGFGAALAFVPFNDRPLEVYINSFFRSIFAPSIYLWQKYPTKLDILASFENFEGREEEDKDALQVSIDDSKLREYLESLPTIGSVKIKNTQVKTAEEEIKTAPAQAKQEDEPSQPQKQEVQTEQAITDQSTGVGPNQAPQFEMPQKEALKATADASFEKIPMPTPPQVANVIVGMVVDKDNRIVEGAIVEIQDLAANPVRVLITDRLGQFRATNALVKGEYLILTEKDGFEFDIIRIKVEDKIIPPVKITAKNNNSRATEDKSIN